MVSIIAAFLALGAVIAVDLMYSVQVEMETRLDALERRMDDIEALEKRVDDLVACVNANNRADRDARKRPC